MKDNKLKLTMVLALILLLVSFNLVFTQVREFKVHDRGMLWQTVFNNGVIGRPFSNWMNSVTKFQSPVLMWPGRSETVLDQIEYDGQHCSLGGGLYLAGWDEDDNWHKGICGAIGTGGNTVISIGRWNFPIEFSEIKNYPILEDGTLNPDYNPDEAEQIIFARFATTAGLTLSRTSRQWSYPDYDDMIIYEYEVEYTGDTDGIESTIEIEGTLTDVLVNYMESMCPSMYGHIRQYGLWRTRPGIIQGDIHAFFDSDYFLHYSMDLASNKTDRTKGGKPEPKYFDEFASTGRNGGGLGSPQAAGYCVLHWSTDHLAVVDTLYPAAGESRYGDLGHPSNFFPDALDENGFVKQPWAIAGQQGWLAESNVVNSKGWAGVAMDPYARAALGGYYQPDEHPNPKWEYLPRGMRQNRTLTLLTKTTAWGPYTLEKGEKVKFAVAEVVGYGAEGGKLVDGGFVDKEQFEPAQDWHKQIVPSQGTPTDDYIADFGYPDFVNSDVRNIQQVAHKAFEAWYGHELPYSDELAKNPIWPEDTPEKGVYTIPVPPPSPVIEVRNTATGEVRITWTQAAEQFSHPRLTGQLTEFRVYRSISGMGPWQLLGTKSRGDYSDNLYVFDDTDPEFNVGDRGYYAVTAVDENGIESGKPNVVFHEKNVGPAEKLSKVHVAPNPFYVESQFTGIGQEDQITFYGLPEKCTIRIYSFAGQLVQTIEHDEPAYAHSWVQVTNNRQIIASGVYFFVVTTPDGDQTRGKFVIIK